jgi:SAM-dependent methyltransferase
MSNKISSEFNPSIFHPIYLVRQIVLKSIIRNKHHIHGIMMDFGCGTKPYKSLFDVEKYIGVDYKGDGHSHENEQIEVFYDGKTIPFSDNYFDSVLCSEVFEHLFNIDDILNELHRVTKPGGKILITTVFVWNLHEVPIDYARYTPYGLKYLFEKNGFKVIISEQNGGYVELISQITILYILQVFKTTKNYYWLKILLAAIRYGLITCINIMGLLLSKILPHRTDLYLDNLVVAEKIRTK